MTCLIVLAIMLLLGIYFFNNSMKNSNPQSQGVNIVDYGPPSSEQLAATEQKKQQIIGEFESPKPKETSAVDFSISLVRADQSIPSQPLNVRALVFGAKNGNCFYNLTRGGKTINKTSDIIFEGTSSRCNADVDLNEFAEPGEWKLELVAESGDKKSNQITQKVNIAKN